MSASSNETVVVNNHLSRIPEIAFECHRHAAQHAPSFMSSSPIEPPEIHYAFEGRNRKAGAIVQYETRSANCRRTATHRPATARAQIPALRAQRSYGQGRGQERGGPTPLDASSARLHFGLDLTNDLVQGFVLAVKSGVCGFEQDPLLDGNGLR